MINEKKIQEKIASQTGISVNQVLLAIRSIPEFTKNEIENQGRPIRWPKWGIFRKKPMRVKKLEKLKEMGLLTNPL